MSIYRKPNWAHEADLDPDLFSQEHGTLNMRNRRITMHKIASITYNIEVRYGQCKSTLDNVSIHTRGQSEDIWAVY